MGPCVLSHFSRTLCDAMVACQAPLSMGFSRQEYWSGLPWPPPGDLPDPGIEPISLKSPALAGGFFITNTTWEAPLFFMESFNLHRRMMFHKKMEPESQIAALAMWEKSCHWYDRVVCIFCSPTGPACTRSPRTVKATVTQLCLTL